MLPPSSPSRKWKLRQSLKNEVETRGLPFRFKVQFLSSPVLLEVQRERERERERERVLVTMQ